MSDKLKTLVIDDEWAEMEPMWFLLRREGLELDFASDDKQAREKYTENFYDLIVIDALLARDFNMRGEEPSGVRIYREIRRFTFARCIPLVILTNYLPRVLPFGLEDADPYLKVLSKGEKAAKLAKEMHDLVGKPAEDLNQDAPAAPERWPNNYPIHVSSGRGHGSIMVHFVPCEGDFDTNARMMQDSGGKWRLDEEFQPLLADPIHRGRVLKMKPRHNPHHLPLGLIYLPDSANNTPWNEMIFFETAPRVRKGVANRDCINCGLALAGRFILECLYRRNLSVRSLLNGSGQIEPQDTIIKPIGEGFDFLAALGFRPFSDQPDLLYASNYVCQEILRRVSHPPER